MKRVMCLLVVVLAIQVAVAAPSYIDNNLMTWQRGDAGSTYQVWTFDDADNPAVPEVNGNIYGEPTATMAELTPIFPYQRSIDFGWLASKSVNGAGTRYGVWAGDPIQVALKIPNTPNDNTSKIIWFEMEYAAVGGFAPVVDAGKGFAVDQIYFNNETSSGWRTMTIGWVISPNPPSESIIFTLWGTGGFVDKITVDTICIPEPTTLVIGGLGAGVLTWLKRRRISKK